ncbi:hypothetical protein CGI03_23280 [Vibrio parahaemolyticus]|nr:hypothetical protein [Vibrio parahaemolyticus]TOL13386.1 hypothetical protein CGI03_23280 [Vibrio parahaemolyticus]TOL58537.1 hypothetical protein CGH95_15455 [Vibrio parahaemolyticus]TOL82572.1 hypothetical protein CGH89_23255 [Vibrio parahaemolyticus]TOM29256.1 hypothetical protein CGH80_23450 [Vibrio parahaemolyticus]
MDLIHKNRDEDVNLIIKTALETKCETLKMRMLLQLDGVAIPMASTILTMFEPERYGVIDRRAWSYLYDNDLVDCNPNGTNLSISQWLTYLSLVRDVAAEFDTTPRLVDLNLYLADKYGLSVVLPRNKTKGTGGCR